MDFTIVIKWASPLSFLGTSGLIFHFSKKIISANRIAPDGTPRFAASHLGLLYLPISHKKDARLIWVKGRKVWSAEDMSSRFLNSQ